jgi:phage-related protein
VVTPPRKPVVWIGCSRKDLKNFPAEVQDEMGYALRDAQYGGKRRSAKPLRGWVGAGVLEVADDFRGDTYRAVYTVNFSGFVYVLHAFQKKSKRGGEVPKVDMDLIRSRYRMAEAHYRHRGGQP